MHCKTVTIFKGLGLGDTLLWLSQKIMNLIVSQYWTTLTHMHEHHNATESLKWLDGYYAICETHETLVHQRS